MNENINAVNYYGDANSKISIDTLGIATFICGMTASVKLEFVGEVFLAEILLIIIGMMLIVFKNSSSFFNSRTLKKFLLFGFLCILGYVISDIYVGTTPSQYLRGWGRVIFMISDMLFITLIISHGRRYLWWFILGAGIGGVLYLAHQGVPWNIWKLGYGEKVSYIVLALSCILPRRFSIILLLVFGILNIGLDYRNMAAEYLLVSGIIWARSSVKSSEQMAVISNSASIKRYMLMGLGLAFSLGILLVGLSLTQSEYAGRRSDSDVGRLSGIIVSIRAVAASPIIGYGSWTINKQYAQMIREEEAKRFDKSRARRAPTYNAKVFRAHSQILQPWVEAGILGVSFFLYYGYSLIRGGKRYAMDLPIDRFTAINLYFIILGAWNLLASPFGGPTRILIAIAIAIVAAIEFDGRMLSKRMSNKVYEKITDDIIESKDTRILRRRK